MIARILVFPKCAFFLHPGLVYWDSTIPMIVQQRTPPQLAVYGQHLFFLYDVHVSLRRTNTIPWVWVNTMGVVIPWVHVYTISPCLYHESMSMPWVLLNYIMGDFWIMSDFLFMGDFWIMGQYSNYSWLLTLLSNLNVWGLLNYVWLLTGGWFVTLLFYMNYRWTMGGKGDRETKRHTQTLRHINTMTRSG